MTPRQETEAERIARNESRLVTTWRSQRSATSGRERRIEQRRAEIGRDGDRRGGPLVATDGLHMVCSAWAAAFGRTPGRGPPTSNSPRGTSNSARPAESPIGSTYAPTPPADGCTRRNTTRPSPSSTSRARRGRNATPTSRRCVPERTSKTLQPQHRNHPPPTDL